MQLFFWRLVRLLNRKNPNWRKDTIILLDGAAYHQSSAMMQFYEDQAMPVLFTGPHSYAASPVELLFAAFKRADINPRKLPTGK